MSLYLFCINYILWYLNMSMLEQSVKLARILSKFILTQETSFINEKQCFSRQS
jgi:hypothetical protein